MADLPRVRCCLPHCNRTRARKPDDSPSVEWICQPHWSATPPAARMAYTKEKSQARRILRRRPQYREWWKLPPGSTARLAALGLWRGLSIAWQRAKAAAIEAAVGI